MQIFRPDLIVLCCFLFCSCLNGEDSEQSTTGDLVKGPECKAHGDCGPGELCFSNGYCAPPWGTRFEMVDCEFDGPGKDDFPDCTVECVRQRSHAGAAQWVFGHKKWGQCITRNYTVGLKNTNVEVRCRLLPNADGVECPEFDSLSSLCLSESCSSFETSHYRSEQLVKLKNSNGYVLSFYLKAIE